MLALVSLLAVLAPPSASGIPLERAFLVKLDNGCTGSLIARDWVLSAAHCIATAPGKEGREGGRRNRTKSCFVSVTYTKLKCILKSSTGGTTRHVGKI